MDETWTRIRLWLEANAPKTRASLNCPATEQQLGTLQENFDSPLPDDLIDLYHQHNGMDHQAIACLFYGFQFLPIETVLREREHTVYGVEHISEEKFHYTDPQIKLWPMHDLLKVVICGGQGHTHIAVDLNPTSQGRYGQVVFYDEEYGVSLLLAHSVSDMVKEFADCLYNSIYQLNPDALEEGNEWLEPSKEHDVNNWQSSQRWAHVKKAIEFRTT